MTVVPPNSKHMQASANLPEAWLFHCWKPGSHTTFCTVDPEDKSWWPRDKWKGVTRVPLMRYGESVLIHGEPPPNEPTIQAAQQYQHPAAETLRELADNCPKGDMVSFAPAALRTLADSIDRLQSNAKNHRLMDAVRRLGVNMTNDEILTFMQSPIRWKIKAGPRAGTVVYPGHDNYGCANDDTRTTGIEHVAVSDSQEGIPFYTMPKRDLELIDSPEENTNNG